MSRPLGFDSGRPAQPRARSRFQFANEQSSPNSEAPASLFSEQPATPEPGYLADGGFLFGKGLPDGHALGVQGVTSSPLWADLGAQVGEGNLVSIPICASFATPDAFADQILGVLASSLLAYPLQRYSFPCIRILYLQG